MIKLSNLWLIIKYSRSIYHISKRDNSDSHKRSRSPGFNTFKGNLKLALYSSHDFPRTKILLDKDDISFIEKKAKVYCKFIFLKTLR